jgi:hypothetical protein
MAGKDEAARKARAEELRREIARWRGEPAGTKPAPTETEPPASPHEFVERRMRELEQEEKQEEAPVCRPRSEKSP